mmetsp:Transcript_42518/g.104715  ORF Transcript_42518/g.104715 Transcript_42518/m.104715 type:complete len:86 (-) Transcript_42518:1258-1515(-)
MRLNFSSTRFLIARDPPWRFIDVLTVLLELKEAAAVPLRQRARDVDPPVVPIARALQRARHTDARQGASAFVQLALRPCELLFEF